MRGAPRFMPSRSSISAAAVSVYAHRPAKSRACGVPAKHVNGLFAEEQTVTTRRSTEPHLRPLQPSGLFLVDLRRP